jgi:cation transport ATPase
VLLRNPAVLERLVAPNLYIFDDGIDLSKRDIAVAAVRSWDRAGAREALALATAAFHESGDPRGPALSSETARRKIERPSISGRKRLAGAVRFLDETGTLVTIATLDQIHGSGQTGAIAALAALPNSTLEPAQADGAPRPLVILRGRELLGTVSFARQGEGQVASAVSFLRKRNPEIRFVHLSSQPQEVAEERADGVRFDAVFGNLSPIDKAEAVKSLGSRSIWIGDGTDPSSAMARLASDVSVSVSKLDRFHDERADIALLSGDLKSLVVPLEAADHHLKRLRADYRTVYFANATALVGGFVAGFGSLRAGLVSNLGTAAVFLARWRALEEIAKEFSRRSHSREAETNFAFGTREAPPRSLSAKLPRASKSTQSKS